MLVTHMAKNGKVLCSGSTGVRASDTYCLVADCKGFALAAELQIIFFPNQAALEGFLQFELRTRIRLPGNWSSWLHGEPVGPHMYM